MRFYFTEPSYSYTIALSEKEIKDLSEGKSLVINPIYHDITVRDCNDNEVNNELNCLHFGYDEERHIQFLCITKDNI